MVIAEKYCTFCIWSLSSVLIFKKEVKHFHICRPGSGHPSSNDVHQDQCIVMVEVADCIASTPSYTEGLNGAL